MSIFDWYRLTPDERRKIANQYHLDKINECLTNLRGHYWIAPKKVEIK